MYFTGAEDVLALQGGGFLGAVTPPRSLGEQARILINLFVIASYFVIGFKRLKIVNFLRAQMVPISKFESLLPVSRFPDLI